MLENIDIIHSLFICHQFPNIQAEVPPENIVTMQEISHEYGKYWLKKWKLFLLVNIY
jgi:hypothetical protein